MIMTNKSFIKEYKNTIRAKYMLHSRNDNHHLTTSNINIGDVLDITIKNVSPTLIEFEYQHRHRGKIIRPEHSGAKLRMSS